MSMLKWRKASAMTMIWFEGGLCSVKYEAKITSTRIVSLAFTEKGWVGAIPSAEQGGDTVWVETDDLNDIKQMVEDKLKAETK